MYCEIDNRIWYVLKSECEKKKKGVGFYTKNVEIFAWADLQLHRGKLSDKMSLYIPKRRVSD